MVTAATTEELATTALAHDAALAATAPIEATATPTPSDTWVPPEHIDHFRVVRRLGQGGMGAVYLAHDTSLDRMVALKLLPVELASNAEAQERFVREARAQAKLTSPHVVQIYFIGRLRGRTGVDQLYFAMEPVDGESLEAVIDRGERLSPERARRFALQAAEGLRDAQQAGIIHRDVKPGNMLVDRKGTLKIADFGLAKPKDPTMHLTKGHAIMGTPLYMAPEQATGDFPLDHRADMYSLGCALYHLLTGEPPLVAPTAVALLLKHVNEAPVPLRVKAPGVPPRLAAIVEKLLRKKPDERFATYEQLIDALDAAAPERVLHAGFWTRGGAAAFDASLASVLIAFLGWPGLVIHLVYLTAAHAVFGQTLGKYLLRIQVRRLDGSKLGVQRSLARTAVALWLPFVLGLSVLWTKGFDDLRDNILQLAQLGTAKSLIGPIVVTNATLTLLFASGFLLAAVTRQKRAVHDFVAGTEVVFRIPEVSAEPAAPPKKGP
jgi:uncharacterized RDD family membrane protein YckC/aminoglycoside phosphotransferase (APT) family kinase protein